MSQIDLYSLIPAIYRIRDSAQNGQLQAFLEILEQELRRLETDIEHLYDNWFIETCDDWVVPYISDLLAVPDLSEDVARLDRQERRTYVANTLAYRQRKGTTPVLEQLSRDITGWGARAVEAQPFVATTQHLNHLRPQSATVNLRHYRPPDPLMEPFQTEGSFTPEICSTPVRRGRYSLIGVALYLWRLQSYAIEHGTPRRLPGAERSFTLNPLGYDAPLFNNPQTETDITELAQAIHIPGELTEATLAAYGDGLPRPVQVFLDGVAVPPAEMLVADAETWPQPGTHSARVALDLKRGRLALLDEVPPDRVEVSYSYGFSGDVGGGPYDRTEDTVLTTITPRTHLIWTVQPSQTSGAGSLTQAIAEWNQFARCWQRCYDLVYLPLARVAVNAEGDIRLIIPTLDEAEVPPLIAPRLVPGIVQGLSVVARQGEMEVQVTAGHAIDGEGQRIELPYPQTVYLGRYRQQSVTLVLSYQAQEGTSALVRRLPRWRLQVVPTAQLGHYPAARYLRLGRVTLDGSGVIQQMDLGGQLHFAPGVMDGLEVRIDPPTASLIVAPGRAVNRRGHLLELSDAAVFSTEGLRGQVALLFLRPGSASRPLRLETVRDVAGGLIQLGGNQTYAPGDPAVSLLVPAGKRLNLVAAGGDRPHWLGDLAVTGIATPTTEDGGELTLEGVLLEGKLTVRPGNLQGLAIAHSTLVPAAGGLQVQRPELEIRDAEPDDATWVAMVMYSLVTLQRLLRVGVGMPHLPLPIRLRYMTEILGQQVATMVKAMHRFAARWSCPPPLPPDDEDEEGLPPDPCAGPPPLNLDADNARLTVQVRRSICGAIALADSVTHLTLTDSIIDAGPVETDEPRALLAPGTDVAIATTTVLGTTAVRSLEASDSLFHGLINSQRRQVGCVRFSYVPQGSQTPRRFRCQPDLSLTEHIGALPVAIAGFSLNPIAQQTLVGTAGQGVYRLIADSQVWVPIADGLTNPTVTALLVDAPPGSGTLASAPGADEGRGVLQGSHTDFTAELQVGDAIAALGQTRTVVAIESDQRLRVDRPFVPSLPQGTPFTRTTLLVGTTGGTLVRASTRIIPGVGLVSSTDLTDDQRAIVTGCGTRLMTELTVGDILIVAGQERQVMGLISETAVLIDTPFSQDLVEADFQVRTAEGLTRGGTGQLNSTRDRTLVSGCGTVFGRDVQVGDRLWVGDQLRTVVALVSDQRLQVSPAFEHDLLGQPFTLLRLGWNPLTTPIRAQGTQTIEGVNTDITTLVAYTMPGSGRVTSDGATLTGHDTQFLTQLMVGETLTLNGQTRRIVAIANDGQTLTLNATLAEPLTTPTPFQVRGVLAGTAGNGVLHSRDEGHTWTTLNQGLTHRAVRAIAVNSTTGQWFVGTAGGGVFYSTLRGLTWSGGDPADVTLRQTGLTDPTITGLAVDAASGAVFAATASGVFRSTDGGVRWQAVNQGLPQVAVTALTGLTRTGQGTIASNYTTLRGSHTRFTQDLAVGDALTAQGQTRRVVAVTDDTTLHLNEPFDPDLPPDTGFTTPLLIAGTTGGTLYRSTNAGDTWHLLIKGLTDTDITSLAIDERPPETAPPTPGILTSRTRRGPLVVHPTPSGLRLLVGTRMGGVFYSPGGDRWLSLNTGLNRVDDMLLLLNQIQPRFTDETYGQPGYAQLAIASPSELYTGAENGAEMGVFNSLKQAQRADNLRASLTEYLRFGMQPDLIYVT